VPGTAENGELASAFVWSESASVDANAPRGRTYCTVDQIDAAARGGGSCADAPVPGYCYVTGAEAPRRCQQALAFSKLGAPAPNVTVLLQCIDARNLEN
jgi:hypothetical protein